MCVYFALSLIGEDRPGIVKEVSSRIHQAGFNIEDSRMAVLGREFGLILLASGPQDSLNAVRDSLVGLQDQGFLVEFKQTDAPSGAPPGTARVPYRVSVYGMDNEGIVHAFADAMAQRQINVEMLETESGAAPLSGADLFSMEMTIAVPGDLPPAELRALITRLGDQHGVDASLSPA